MEIPKFCHVIHTETIQRHGSRHLNNVNKLDKAVHYFENARIHIEAEAYEKGCKYIPEHFHVNVFQDEYRLCEEVRIVKIGGHSRGSCIVEVTLDGKEYVLCGDECYVHYNLENHIPTAKRYSLERSRYFIDKYSNSRYICLLSHEE